MPQHAGYGATKSGAGWRQGAGDPNSDVGCRLRAPFAAKLRADWPASRISTGAKTPETKKASAKGI